MSLDWSISKCEDWEELTNDEEWPLTNALIWMTISTDIGEITEKNADEFYTRIRMVESVHGYSFFKTDPETKARKSAITYESIRRRIGLSTNVITKTPNQFNKRIIEAVRRYADDDMRYERGKFNERSAAA